MTDTPGPTRKTLEQLDSEAARFNAAYPTGAVVIYHASPFALRKWCRVSSPAFVLSEHTAVVQLDNVRGVVACDACSRPDSEPMP